MKATNPELTDLIVKGIQERKGRSIVHIDLSAIETSAASDFIVCEGTSTTHVAAIADSVRDYLLENHGVKPYNYDGYGNSSWIVIDYGSTLVHVFMPDERRRYNLEELWSDGRITEIPDLD
ncbi:MAG: ribosome silencing factor [Muribaculaceae bacterium]|nr:ribosome silencing factor [Muribaculaceae bacterium]MDE5959164.1 ribosome silencing factor [Muribaculaceae bacterium]MDE5971158.1 ribosome silencing factor [Muribaculaceae bacterium]MDE6462466.1 ribosome silencing factor [Muribaculaceae bacterium]MDE6509679.1 ribosome silencing factor [Muribaculaceae bacterium]